MTPAIKPDRMGILLRVGLFILIGWLGTVIFSFLMYTVAGIGIFATSAMSTFAAAAVANAITVRVYERGRLSDLGLGWTATSKREMFLGFAAAAGAAVVILGGPLATGFAHFEPSPGVETVDYTLTALADEPPATVSRVADKPESGDGS